MAEIMGKTRILIVDDSVVIRRLLTTVLTSDPDLEVVGVAANGHIALAKLDQVSPDVVILDIEMPEMNGLETLAALRKHHPFLPVIMFSALTEQGAVHTLEALSLGATDYITKPSGVGNPDAAGDTVRDELIPRIKALHRPAVARVAPARPAFAAPARMPASEAVDVVAIGVSTGGPNALAALLPLLPESLSAPILVVQHMPPLFTRFLADRLDAQCALTVREGSAGQKVEPGTVWIAPGDWHMTVERSGTAVTLATHQGVPENSCRPAVDVLFRSVASVYGPRSLAVVLTGMGQDGLRGAEDIHERGGRVVVQDEATSVVWGMPGFIANAGIADRVLPLEQIAQEIIRRTTRTAVRPVA
jgi:two-component system, chemotaxis family, protein-glutamate methylesterase/glutaminase